MKYESNTQINHKYKVKETPYATHSCIRSIQLPDFQYHIEQAYLKAPNLH